MPNHLKSDGQQREEAFAYIKNRHPSFSKEEVDAEYRRLREKGLSYTPLRYRSAKAEDIPDAVSSCLDFSGDKNGLYLWGSVGSGKTHTLYAIREYYLRGCSFLYVKSFAAILQEIRDSFDKESYGEVVDITEYARKKNVSVAIDDIGAEKETEWAGEQLYRLVNHAYENRSPIIFTSNLSIAKLAERYGETGDRIASRIAQMCYVVELSGKDRRLSKV